MVYLIILFMIIVLLYYYLTRNHDYWVKRNVKQDSPLPLFGNYIKNFIGIKSVTEIAVELYNKYPNEKVIGNFRGNRPELMIRDPDIIRKILNVDFPYFHLRGSSGSTKRQPIFLKYLHGDGDYWKLMRQQWTAAFTTAKIKKMLPLMVKCAEKLQTVTHKLMKEGTEVEADVRDLMARFTIEVIGTCGLGIDLDTINNERSQFRELGKLIFTRTWKDLIVDGLVEFFPIFKLFTGMLKNEIDETIINIYREICKNRNFKPSDRHDFMDLMLQIKENGKIKGESVERRNPDGSPISIEMEVDELCIAAQLFIFFAAGFETSSSSSSFTLHQLAYNPEKQRKIQEEIDNVLSKYDNKLCYDAINEIKESLRLLSPAGIFTRVCVKRYTFSELNLTIDPGVRILIPIQAIHKDEKYFENSCQFKPERFSDEAEAGWHKYVYLPFGEGPRACIGKKLAQMQSMVGLAALLQKFDFELARCSTPNPELNPLSNNVQSVKNEPLLKITTRKYKRS